MRQDDPSLPEAMKRFIQYSFFSPTMYRPSLRHKFGTPQQVSMLVVYCRKCTYYHKDDLRFFTIITLPVATIMASNPIIVMSQIQRVDPPSSETSIAIIIQVLN